MPDAQRTAYEKWERGQHWYKLACELGQRDDFLALIKAERRDAVEEYKRATERSVAEPMCLAERKPWATCLLVAGHEGDHSWS